MNVYELNHATTSCHLCLARSKAIVGMMCATVEFKVKRLSIRPLISQPVSPAVRDVAVTHQMTVCVSICHRIIVCESLYWRRHRNARMTDVTKAPTRGR